MHAVRTLLTVVKEKLPENTEKNKGKEEDSGQLKITLESIQRILERYVQECPSYHSR